MRGQRALLVAVVLVAIVIVAYVVGGGAHKYTPLIAAGAAVGVLLLVNRRARGRASAFHAGNKDGLAALARGDFGAARAAWERWGETPGAPRIAALARHNIAWTLIREGEFARAIAMLEGNEGKYLAALDAIGLSATSAADRALAHALRGDSKDAQAWLDRATERMLKATIPTAGALALASAIVHCRAGRLEEASKLLEQQWTEIEATTTGDVLRPLRVVRAFVQATGPRAGGPALAALPTIRPAYPGEYAFLGAAWPQMAVFLASHELAPHTA